MTSARDGREGNVFAKLRPSESADVLRSLLKNHPELIAEAEELAKAMVTDIDGGGVADDVEQTVLDLGLEDLGARAGRHNWGYVEPTEAAWDLLEEALDPFLDEMKRHIDLGLEAEAIATCAGIVGGLYRCRGKNADQVLGWAEDFPAEAAGCAVAALAQESSAQHGRIWRIPDTIVDQFPEWTDMIRDASKPTPP